MRLRVRNEIVCRYRPAATNVVGLMRLTPRDHYGQHVIDWSIDVSVDCRLRVSEDAFGNQAHAFEVTGPLETLTIEATGEVDLFDSTGFVRDAIERFPVELYLRETQATAADLALRAFADEAMAKAPAPLGAMHALMGALHERVTCDPAAAPVDSASAAFAARSGAAADLAHAFIAAARHSGAPARFVSGYAADPQGEGASAHAWAEVWLDEYGWIAFDPAANVCPHGRHLRVAIGLERLGAAPLRSVRGGYGEEQVASEVAFVAPYRQEQ
ncbi:MAG: transglutaminase family protein [Rhizobiales bacterium]|nr:transglutaminase family protein [Hyphomicrobiales bacterium]